MVTILDFDLAHVQGKQPPSANSTGRYLQIPNRFVSGTEKGDVKIRFLHNALHKPTNQRTQWDYLLLAAYDLEIPLFTEIDAKIDAANIITKCIEDHFLPGRQY